MDLHEIESVVLATVVDHAELASVIVESGVLEGWALDVARQIAEGQKASQVGGSIDGALEALRGHGIAPANLPRWLAMGRRLKCSEDAAGALRDRLRGES